MKKAAKGKGMLNKRIIISGMIVNSLAACSSYQMELPQPKGDWVDFEPANIQPAAAAADSKIIDAPAVTLRAVNASAGAHRMDFPVTTAEMDRFIAGSGSNVSLYTAVRSLVPPAWNVTLSPDVSERFKGRVSWTGNDQWLYVLRKSLNAIGMTPQIDARRKEVVVNFSAQATKKTAAVAPLQSAKSAASPAAVAAKNIFSGAALTPPAVPVVTEAVKPPVVSKPVILMPVLKTWTIGKGTTLKAGYASWAAKEKCAALHRDWMIRWETDTDYPIDYPLSFSSATFEDATSQLFNLYRTAQAPLYVSGYRNQCLIVISDKK